MKYIESKQKADICYMSIPKALVKDMKGECAIAIEIRPEYDGEVILQECVDECFSDHASGKHYTISYNKIDQKIVEKREMYACVVVTYDVKDMY